MNSSVGAPFAGQISDRLQISDSGGTVGRMEGNCVYVCMCVYVCREVLRDARCDVYVVCARVLPVASWNLEGAEK